MEFGTQNKLNILMNIVLGIDGLDPKLQSDTFILSEAAVRR